MARTRVEGLTTGAKPWTPAKAVAAIASMENFMVTRVGGFVRRRDGPQVRNCERGDESKDETRGRCVFLARAGRVAVFATRVGAKMQPRTSASPHHLLHSLKLNVFPASPFDWDLSTNIRGVVFTTRLKNKIMMVSGTKQEPLQIAIQRDQVTSHMASIYWVDLE